MRVCFAVLFSFRGKFGRKIPAECSQFFFPRGFYPSELLSLARVVCGMELNVVVGGLCFRSELLWVRLGRIGRGRTLEGCVELK